jgi:hypothetical protein
MLLARVIDTTVRGIVYETRGSVPEDVLTAGSELVTRACERSHVPFALIEAPPEDHQTWLADALAATERLVS